MPRSGSRGARRRAISANISLPEDCERLVEETKAAYGPAEVLVNNAALTYFIPIKDFPLSRWLRTWSVNIHAPFLLSQLVLPDMIEAKGGSIVNISSSSAIGPGRAPYDENARKDIAETCYGAQKAALERFTQGLALEVYEYGVSVTCLSPSVVVPTPGTLYHKLVSSMDDPKGEHPDLMAKATLLLATEPQEKITGRVTYTQEILKEYGMMGEGQGVGVTKPGSGYSQI